MISYDEAKQALTVSNETNQTGAPALSPCKQYARPHYQIGKRLFDIIVSAVALVILLPLFLLVFLAVVATSGFPAVFKHKRVGRNGKEFYMFKFRTMVKNADEILKSRPELLEEYRRTYKIVNDPRISPLGKILRKTSLDELPQLINVLAGDMSLVGPRPIVPPELAMYGENQHIYLYMKPGCAGLWQCSGRSDLSYDDRVKLDLMYCRKASLRYDFLILLRTVGTIFSGKGAA